MCGIIGITDSDTIAYDLYNALLTVQHRGQDSAGIITTDDFHTYIHRGAGLVKEVFNREMLETFGGRDGIGQVRYPTVGHSGDYASEEERTKKAVRDAQPSYIRNPGIAMVHNGNIINYFSLREKLRAQRHFLKSECDVEVINRMFAQLLSDATYPGRKITEEVIFSCLGTLMNDILVGSYSAIAEIQGVGMVAFRDPYGIRPFVMGERELPDGSTSYGFASETVALDGLGFKKVRDIRKGEAIFIPRSTAALPVAEGDGPGGSGRTGEPIHRPPVSKILARSGKTAHCFFEWIYFSRPSSSFENLNVYVIRRNLGIKMAEAIGKRPFARELDLVAPIPDTSRPAALMLAQALGKSYIEIFDKNRYSKRSFIMPNEEERKKEIVLKLTPIIYEIRGKNIMVVDDSIVRGPTARKVVQNLRDAGAREVHFAISCPPITHRCTLGIDLASEEELIAARLDGDIDAITEEIGADSVNYLPLDLMVEAIGKEGELCLGCLTGSYPVHASREEEDAFARARRDGRGEVPVTGVDVVRPP